MKYKKILTLLFTAFVLLGCNNQSVFIKNIEIKTKPDKTNYIEGEHFVPDGLTISVNKSDGNSEIVEYTSHQEDFSFIPDLSTPLEINTNQFVIYKKDFLMRIDIKVDEAILPSKVNFVIKDIESTSIHTALQEQYALCDDPDKFFEDNFNGDNLFGRKNLSTPNYIDIKYDITEDGNVPGEYFVYSSETSDFKSFYKHDGDINHTALYNLKIDTQYYCKVVAKYRESVFENDQIIEFKTDKTTIRNIYVDGVENVRDLGGYVNEEGKLIKQGLIYRTAQFNYNHDNSNAIKSEPSEKGKDVLLNQLKIKTEIDVRDKYKSSGDETDGLSVSPLGESVNYHNLSMRFGGSNVITNDYNKEAIKTFLEICADENSYPIAFHCVRGTDRTGALAYVLGALCGMSELDLLKDYLFSNFSNIGASVYIKSDAISTKYVQDIRNEEGNSISEKTKNYLIKIIGVSPDTLNKIINIMVEDL